MKNEDIETTLIELIDNLKISINNLEKNEEKIKQEIKQYNSEITTDELKDILPMILGKVKKWYNIYTKTNNILDIDVEEYSTILKEYAYILGECALIDELNAKVIDWQIGTIGYHMKKLLKEDR